MIGGYFWSGEYRLVFIVRALTMSDDSMFKLLIFAGYAVEQKRKQSVKGLRQCVI